MKSLDLLDMASRNGFSLRMLPCVNQTLSRRNWRRELMSPVDSIQNSFEISQGIKDRIEYYLSQNSDLEVTFQKHLYIQGAKDCVAVLRELGVIK